MLNFFVSQVTSSRNSSRPPSATRETVRCSSRRSSLPGVQAARSERISGSKNLLVCSFTVRIFEQDLSRNLKTWRILSRLRSVAREFHATSS